jgi:hypothetical protein
MMRLSEKRRRELQRRAPAAGRTVEGDREFFERRRDRSYRLRLAFRVKLHHAPLLTTNRMTCPQASPCTSPFGESCRARACTSPLSCASGPT